MEELTVDPRFRDVLPNLTNEEIRTLEANIKADGKIKRPIVVWGDTSIIVDGHNRYRIAKKLGMPFEIERRHFPSADEALAWAIDNQFGQRNLSGVRASVVRSKRAELIGNKLDDVAQVVGVSDRQLRTDKRVAQALEEVPEDVREKVKNTSTQADLLTLSKLDETEKQEVLSKLGDATLAEALPKKEKPKHAFNEEQMALITQYFDGDARKKVFAGMPVTDSQIKHIAGCTPVRRQLIMDLVASGCSFTEAIDNARRPAKSQGDVSLEITKIAEKIEDTIAKLVMAMDTYMELKGLAGSMAYAVLRDEVACLSIELAKVEA